jgi:DNA-3-methyladenine glycosylase
MARLSRQFYNGDTVEIAQKLLGKYLVRRIRNREYLVGRITETEAYIGRCDKACHAYGGRKTERTATLFSKPGTAYIYLIYGMHHCLNFVTEPEGEAAAVLLRSVEAVHGLKTMQMLRYGEKEMTPYRVKNLLNGPGKVCKAFSLTRSENGFDLIEQDELFLCDSPEDVGLPCPAPKKEHVCVGPRIGIDYAEEAREFPWRFWLEQEEA